MDLTEFFDEIIDPSTERLGLFGMAHEILFDGRAFIVSHKVSKNVLTDFDGRLSRYLAAVHGRGLPGASVETWIRDVATGRSWSPYPIRNVASLPEALSLAALLALGPEQQMYVNLGAWMSDEQSLEQERIITSETVAALEQALVVCRLIGSTEFLEVSGDFERLLVKPAGARLDTISIDMQRGIISIPTTAEMGGTAYQGPLFGFEKIVNSHQSVIAYLGKARHAVASAKEQAILSFREHAEDRIHQFDAALAGRPLTGYRLDSATALIARLQTGLGDTLLGLSEAAQITALDWATQFSSASLLDHEMGDDPGLPPGPRLVS
ncbi:MAG: hypothetical protein AAF334_02085 [Pseudomonadota bacterium]